MCERKQVSLCLISSNFLSCSFSFKQAQNEELKVAKEQIADGAKERLLWEEMGEENSRLKTQAASLSLLQNENERMTRELESVRSLQQEVETLRSTVTELKRSSGTK